MEYLGVEIPEVLNIYKFKYEDLDKDINGVVVCIVEYESKGKTKYYIDKVYRGTLRNVINKVKFWQDFQLDSNKKVESLDNLKVELCLVK